MGWDASVVKCTGQIQWPLESTNSGCLVDERDGNAVGVNRSFSLFLEGDSF